MAVLSNAAAFHYKKSAYFDDNVIEQYTADESAVDGVNVPSRVYRIETEITEHGRY